MDFAVLQETPELEPTHDKCVINRILSAKKRVETVNLLQFADMSQEDMSDLLKFLFTLIQIKISLIQKKINAQVEWISRVFLGHKG